MTSFEEKIRKLKHVCMNPGAQMEYYQNQGKKVIGCFPPFVPEELIHALGMIPFGCWGANREIKFAKKYLPAFACSVLQENLEMGLDGTYQGLAAVVIPTLCDTLRCMTQDWRYGVKNIPMIPITYPQNRGIPAAGDFLLSEFETLLTRLEVLTGQMLNDEALEQTIAVYNEHSRAMMDFAKTANSHLNVISPAVRHVVMKSAFFMEKSEHTQIVKEMTAELEKMPEYDFRGIKVILSGILAEPQEVWDIFQENGIAVVGDDLVQESQQYRTLIPEEGTTPLRRLANQWMNRSCCSVIHEKNKQRGEMLVRLCEETRADGVIYCLMKFCDPEEYDYPICERIARQNGYPMLPIEIDQLSANCQQLRTRIQTFREML